VSELFYIGGLSGGIDSQAAARFMLNRYGAACIILVNSDAGGNNGAGTTGLVALRLGRKYIGIELNPEYVAMSAKRTREDASLFWQGECS
jgi:hypothetical protein